MPNLPPVDPNSKPQSTPRFKGFTMIPIYQDVLEDQLKNNLRQPEDRNQPKVQDQITGGFNG